MRSSYKVISSLLFVMLVGCAAIVVTPQARKVVVSPNRAPKGCQYLDQVVGNQGNFFVGAYTSNAHLEEGAMNDLRNKASILGGNYVQLISSRAGITGNMGGSLDTRSVGGSSQQTNVTNVGNVYYCPPKLIGLVPNL